MKLNIIVATGSRSEYGILKNLIRDLSENHNCDLLVMGSHLAAEFGTTINEIHLDKIKVKHKVDSFVGSKKEIQIIQSMAKIMLEVSSILDKNTYDMIVVLGDRYEIFSVSSVALIQNLPIIHIHGGEVTIGAIDEQMRHAITKMSYLHFTSHEDYRRRIIQLGEFPNRVFNVGSLAVEQLKSISVVSKREIFRITSIPLSPDKPYVIMTFHSVTHEGNTHINQVIEIFNALETYSNLNIIITKSNADLGGQELNDFYVNYVIKNNNAYLVDSLGTEKYWTLSKWAEFVIGNSSSAIIELASLKVPVINVGDRQRGRIRPNNVIDCHPKRDEIIDSIEKVASPLFKKSLKTLENPYEGNDTSKKIIQIIEEAFREREISLKKDFFDIRGFNE
jgi:GDP/UDP-N,N'-diacetylbacillosamine 2-epimerase (hydrolysing)